jgi:hypothetical protein
MLLALPPNQKGYRILGWLFCFLGRAAVAWLGGASLGAAASTDPMVLKRDEGRERWGWVYGTVKGAFGCGLRAYIDISTGCNC